MAANILIKLNEKALVTLVNAKFRINKEIPVVHESFKKRRMCVYIVSIYIYDICNTEIRT